VALELVFFQGPITFKLIIFTQNSAHVLVKLFQLSLGHGVLLAQNVLRCHVNFVCLLLNVDLVLIQHFLDLKLVNLLLGLSKILLHVLDREVELLDFIVSLLVLLVVPFHDHISLNEFLLYLDLFRQRQLFGHTVSRIAHSSR
jgi:hypothetical protein